MGAEAPRASCLTTALCYEPWPVRLLTAQSPQVSVALCLELSAGLASESTTYESRRIHYLDSRLTRVGPVSSEYDQTVAPSHLHAMLLQFHMHVAQEPCRGRPSQHIHRLSDRIRKYTEERYHGCPHPLHHIWVASGYRGQ
jgi:hypothetical protein